MLLLILLISGVFHESVSLSDEAQSLTIGAIIEDGDTTVEIAFREGVLNANHRLQNNGNQSTVDQLVPRIEYTKKGDSFQASKKACELFKGGVIAIVGPSDPELANHIIAISRQLNIPYLQTGWGLWHRAVSHTINVHPNVLSFTEAIRSYIAEQNWDSLGLIYSEEKDLIKYEPFLKNYTKRVMVRQWKSSNEESYKSVMRYLYTVQQRRFIVDIPYWQIKDFLIMASMYNMTTEYYSYLFTDWDVHLLDLTPFKIGYAANLTCLSIVNAPTEMEDMTSTIANYSNFVERVYEAEQKRRSKDIQKGLPTHVALTYDAVLIFTHGLMELTKTQSIQPPKVSCEEGSSWALGGSLVKSVNSIPKNTVIGLTKEVHLTSGIRDDFNMSILEVGAKGFRQLGYWTNSTGLQTTKSYAQTRKESAVLLSNIILRVTTIEDSPFAMALKRDMNGVPSQDPRDWGGFCIDLLMTIAHELNISVTIHRVKDNRYGSRTVREDGTESWNGMIGELLSGEADMAVAPITITYERERVVDFTTPFMTAGLSIIYQRPQSKQKILFSFLQPLSAIVWVFVLVCYVVVTLVLFAVARFSPYEWLNPHPCSRDSSVVKKQFTVLNCFWFVWGSLMQQGTEMTPKATSTRIVVGIWGFFTLLMISSYTANLAAFLTVERMVPPIDGAESLSRQTKIKYGVLSAGSSYNFFEQSKMDVYKRMFEFMKANKEISFVNSIREGIARVSEDYAFILESTMNEFYWQRNCSLMSVGGQLDSKGYGIALPPGSPYRDLISETILKLQKSQTIERLRYRWWGEYNITKPCRSQEEISISASSLDMEQLGGVFVLLLIGIGLALFVSLVEFIYKTMTNRTDNTNLQHPEEASKAHSSQVPSSNMERGNN